MKKPNEISRSFRESFGDRFIQFELPKEILGEILPENKNELQYLVKYGNEKKLKFHVVSSGKNWGFGGREANNLEPYYIINLKNMNKILEFNRTLAYVVVEAGVTYKRLFDYLKSECSGELLIDAPGSSMEASVVGNLLERGHGQTNYCDHINTACNFEVLLGNETTVNTGFGGFSKNNLENLDKWGVGPQIEGLFSQSNFGIVTQATIWLLPRSSESALIQLGFNSKSFNKVVDQLMTLRLKKVLHTGPHFANVYFLISRLYKLKDLTDEPFLKLEEAIEIGRKNGISEWTANLVIHGTKESIGSDFKLIEYVLSSDVETIKINYDSEINPTSKENGIKTDQQKFLDQISGRLGGTGISRMFWRKAKSEANAYDADIDKHEVGVLCVPVASPATSSSMEKVNQIVQEICFKHNTEPFSAYFTIRDRIIHIHNFLLFDKSSLEQTERHIQCSKSLDKALAVEGFIPHRLRSDMDLSDYNLSSGNSELIAAIKKYCDPHSLFIDKRYVR